MIKILCVGKLKEQYWKDALMEYQKRLLKYTKFSIIEVSDETGNHIPTILEQEKVLLMKHIDSKDYVVAMAIEGKEISSIELSKMIDTIVVSYSNIVFVIGGSYGLHQDIKNRANCLLSFSKLTFPHQMFRILLLEQLYRSYKIINHENYHK
ncbi:MAG: 23S rRNA (pseudouridine(1915)-N(3))-methyltransferase RlmH [Bacilli bacterium]|nr:23S rRNA (pseudouridine(1915)-N(3))-methyltransferase RlmH [Bacilli bacterium]